MNFLLKHSSRGFVSKYIKPDFLIKINAHNQRFVKYSSGKDVNVNLPRLMNFPEILWPSTLKTMKNWFLIKFVIIPYLDNEFNINQFVTGSKQALELISRKLSKGECSSLDSYLTSDALQELKSRTENLSLAQRRHLEITKNDIYFSFPYQIGLITEESESTVQKRWVEITMVYHVLRGMRDLINQNQNISWNMGTLPEYREHLYICNYRFIREFSSKTDCDWKINMLNHFRPFDLINNPHEI